LSAKPFYPIKRNALKKHHVKTARRRFPKKTGVVNTDTRFLLRIVHDKNLFRTGFLVTFYLPCFRHKPFAAQLTQHKQKCTGQNNARASWRIKLIGQG